MDSWRRSTRSMRHATAIVRAARSRDYVISPRVMGQSMELHPLAAIFGVLAGGEIAGVLGIYLSIPIMASLRIVWRRWRLYAEKKRFGPLNEYSFGSEITPRT